MFDNFANVKPMQLCSPACKWVENLYCLHKLLLNSHHIAFGHIVYENGHNGSVVLTKVKYTHNILQ